MAITYSYQIHELKTIPTVGELEQVITEVFYSYIGTNEDGITSQYPGRTALPTPDSESFTPVNELTPELVEEWLEANAELNIMKQAIEAHIEQQSGTILRGSTLPWAVEEEITISPVSGSVSGSI
jgi:hypothetical protein